MHESFTIFAKTYIMETKRHLKIIMTVCIKHYNCQVEMTIETRT